MELSDKIRIIRKARGFSQEKLGESLSGLNNSGISRQSVSDWESGKSEPKLDNIRDLAKVLNVSFDALLDDTLNLNDQNVLNSVLKNLQPEVKERVNSKFRYRLYPYTVTKKDYVKTYLSLVVISLLLLTFVIMLVLSFMKVVNWWFAYGFGVAFMLSLAFLSILISGIKDIKKGGFSVSCGELNNTHLIVDSANAADNTIYVPIEKIEKMELGEGAKKNHGPVLVYVSGRANPMILLDLKEPEKLIEIFHNLNSYIENTDEIKIM